MKKTPHRSVQVPHRNESLRRAIAYVIALLTKLRSSHRGNRVWPPRGIEPIHI